MKKLTRAEKYKKRYDVIRNVTGDPVLARRARTWGNDRIYSELGIKIPKKAPILKPIPVGKELRRKQRRLEKYLYGRSIGLAPVDAVKLKSYNKHKIKNTKEYLDKKSKRFYNIPSSKEKRRELWKKWSKDGKVITNKYGKKIYKNNLPPYINEMAIQINRETKNGEGVLDDTDRYGYAIAFYMFIEDKDDEAIKERYEVDRYDGDKYIEAIRRKR